MSSVRPLRPRLVIRIGKDRSFDFAATSDIEIIIVREGFGSFRALPSLKIGIEHVRRLLSSRPHPSSRQQVARKNAP